MPNGGIDADRATAGCEHCPRSDAGAGGGAGRHAVATHQRRDEALSLPTEESARLALRTQQIIAHETGVTNVADPCGGSFHIERMTDEIERGAREYIERINALGGTLAAIENGFLQSEIQNAAYEFQQSVDRGETIVVGVNRFRNEGEIRR